MGMITAGAGFWLMQPAEAGGVGISKWIVLPIVMVATLLLLRIIPAGDQYKQNLSRQYRIFSNKHTWAMTIIYTMTFGSFIGFSAGFAMLAKTQFPAVDILKLAFFGPFIDRKSVV